ncbi:MAG: hypothetical protein QXP53_02745 [Candidatus Pacearchaeota archaeon]
MKKAQVTIEFTLLVAAAVFLVVIVISSTNFNTALARAKNEQEALDDFANYIQQELMLASEMHPVYERTITLPQRIVGKTYTVTIDRYLLTVSTSKFTVNRGIPLVSEVYGNSLPPPQSLSPGDNIIETSQEVSGNLIIKISQ